MTDAEASGRGLACEAFCNAPADSWIEAELAQEGVDAIVVHDVLQFGATDLNGLRQVVRHVPVPWHVLTVFDVAEGLPASGNGQRTDESADGGNHHA